MHRHRASIDERYVLKNNDMKSGVDTEYLQRILSHLKSALAYGLTHASNSVPGDPYVWEYI